MGGAGSDHPFRGVADAPRLAAAIRGEAGTAEPFATGGAVDERPRGKRYRPAERALFMFSPRHRYLR